MPLAATAAYLAIAAFVWREEALELHAGFGAGSVKSLSAAARAPLARIEARLRAEWAGGADNASAAAILRGEPDAVALTLYRSTGEADRWEVAAFARDPEYLRLHGLGDDGIEHVRERVPVPFAAVIARGAFAFGSNHAGAAPLLTLAVSLPPGKVAVADLKLDAFVDLLRDQKGRTAFLVDEDGRVVAHPDPSLTSSRASLAGSDLVRAALASDGTAAGELEFVSAGRAWLGHFAPVGVGGLRVLSQVERSRIFHPLTRLALKSLLLAALILTVGFWLTRRG